MKIHKTAHEDEAVERLACDILDAIGRAGCDGEYSDLDTASFNEDGEILILTQDGRRFTLQIWEHV